MGLQARWYLDMGKPTSLPDASVGHAAEEEAADGDPPPSLLGAGGPKAALLEALVWREWGADEYARARLGTAIESGSEPLAAVAEALQRHFAGVALDQAELARVELALSGFARLALLPPPTEPSAERAAWYADAALRVAVGGFAMLAAVGGLIAGLVIGPIALVRWRRGWTRPALQVTSATRDGGAALDAFAWYMVLWVGWQLLCGVVLGANFLAGLWLFVWIIPFWWWWLRRAGMDRGDIAAATCGPRPGGVWSEVGAGVVAWMAMLPVIAGMIVLTNWLSQWLPAPDNALVSEGLRSPSAWLVVLMAVVFAPIVEELAFRGLLFQHLRARCGWWCAALVAGLIFTLAHGYGPLGIPLLMVLAVGLTVVRTWRGGMVAAMTVHACHNGVVVALAWATLV